MGFSGRTGRNVSPLLVQGSQFMVVKIRFGEGSRISRRQGKNAPIAMLAASLLTLLSISCASLGLWRLGTDLDWAGDFVFRSGLLSHWQVWIGAAALIQYASWRLAQYSQTTRYVEEVPEADAAETPSTARV